MKTDAFDPLSALGLEADLTEIRKLSDYAPKGQSGPSKFRHTFTNGRHLDLLLMNHPSNTLVVSFHGAIDRRKYALPRFERFKSLDKFPVSALYIGDPSLWASDSLELAWHTGWKDVDLNKVYADLIIKTADAIGAKNIVLNGGSGGGFAALQVSALIPGSIAVAYNPQTSIYAYEHPRWPHMPQNRYIRDVWPELVNLETYDYSHDWTLPLGDRLSAVRRYRSPQKNKVVFMINTEDTHHFEYHFKPFESAIQASGNNMRTLTYQGGEGHNPTTFKQFKEGLDVALEWFDTEI